MFWTFQSDSFDVTEKWRKRLGSVPLLRWKPCLHSIVADSSVPTTQADESRLTEFSYETFRKKDAPLGGK